MEEPFEFTPFNNSGIAFNVPLYQRLYSWERQHVIQLLEDLYSSFTKSPGKDYFLGNLVLSKKDGRYDLIDGQQRITTLWLAAVILKQYCGDWMNFLKENTIIRLSFNTRDAEKKDLESLCVLDVADSEQTLLKINPAMRETILLIKDFLQNTVTKDNREVFSRYVYEHSKMVCIVLPEKTDLNKYFEVMNNRGIQLEKHQILKANILSKISPDLQSKYAAIWDACSQMGQYLESAFPNETIKKLIADFSTEQDIINAFISAIDTSENSISDSKTLDQLISEARQEQVKESSQVKVPSPEDKYGSIVTFPVFLMHVFRIYSKNKNSSTKDTDLLETVKVEDPVQFIQLLLKCRILFDKYLIKSVRVDNDYRWEIRNLKMVLANSNGDGYTRKRHLENSTQIQAMLNVSTDHRKWLTDVLEYLLSEKIVECEKFTAFLEALDNRINCPDGQLPCLDDGTGTPRYWFYKLDYCLLKKWKDAEAEELSKELSGLKIERLCDKIKNFQFRYNRSVEHVHPQNPEQGEIWDTNDLNSFGNLALISSSSNSSYSNKPFGVKKAEFIERANNGFIESLKLLEIYKSEKWRPEEAQKHRGCMINIFQEYHSQNNTRSIIKD